MEDILAFALYTIKETKSYNLNHERVPKSYVVEQDWTADESFEPISSIELVTTQQFDAFCAKV